MSLRIGRRQFPEQLIERVPDEEVRNDWDSVCELSQAKDETP